MNESLLFYDIEIFKEDALVVFLNAEKQLLRYFHNDFTNLQDFIKGKTLIGYNNYHYDDKVLSGMLDEQTPTQLKQINDRIIGGSKVDKAKPWLNTLDCFQQIDVAMPGLKKIEGNMGKMIFESAIPFTIDRKLTEEEFLETLDYCIYDVEMTVDIYNMRKTTYFEPKEYLVSMLPKVPNTAFRWNTTTLSANVLLDKPLTAWSNIRLGPNADELWQVVPPEARELWSLSATDVIGKPKGSATVQEFDCDIQFGFGGLHGAHRTIKQVKNVKLLDVASMYPNIILYLDALGKATPKYRKILEKRLEVKHTDKKQSDALKLILNSVYGNLKNEYSILKNFAAALSVCIYGQIALYDLCKRLAPSCTIININTDGVAFTTEHEHYKEVWKEWEQDYHLDLEEDQFDLFIQKDVNNYIAVQNGEIKTKGGDTSRYHSDALFKNNNARILDIALVDYLVHGKEVLDTIVENLDKPHLFQYILQAGGTYLGTFDNNDNRYNKINRAFAAKKMKSVPEFCLFKKRHDGGMVRYADAPMNMYLHNDDCSKLENFSKIVDLNHYYQIIKKRLERWE